MKTKTENTSLDLCPKSQEQQELIKETQEELKALQEIIEAFNNFED